MRSNSVMPAPEVYGRPPWKIRRRIVNLSLLFCAGSVAWLLVAGEDNELNRAIANGAFVLAGAVIASYVFGAAWDDANVMRTLGPRAYQDQVPMLPDYSRPADAAGFYDGMPDGEPGGDQVR